MLAWGYAVVIVVSELAENAGGHVPVVHHAGNLVFGLTILAAVGTEVALWRRGDPRQDVRYGLGSVGTLLLAFAIWIPAQSGSALCDPTSLLQGHAAWHVLDAAAAYLLFRHYAAEGDR